MYIQKRRIVADTEPEMAPETEELEGGAVEVAPEATDLLFEAEDVAELIAEVTGQPVEVTTDEDVVEFAVGDDVFTVEADGNEEVLEAVRKPLRGKRAVAASTTRRVANRPVAPAGRTVRQMGRRK